MKTYKQFKDQKGFTLIELLVVIAIIGLLSAVVLASLNSTRAKGADAAMRSDLRSVQSQAEIIYDDNNPDSYSGLCTNAEVVAMLTHAMNAVGISTALNTTLATAGSNSTATCHISADNFTWAIEIPTKANSSVGWCIDSVGHSRAGTHLGASAVVCP